MKKLFVFLTLFTGSCFLAANCPQDIFPVCCDSLAISGSIPITDPPQYPLDPLTPSELCQAVTLVQEYIHERDTPPDSRLLFDRVELYPPNKKDVLAFQAGDPLVRRAFVAIYSPTEDKYHALLINLTANTVDSYEHIHNARPSFTNVDNKNVALLINQNRDVIRAMAKRGITAEDLACGRVQYDICVDGRLNDLSCSKNDSLSQCKAKKSNGCAECTKGMPNLNDKPRPRSYYAIAYLLDSCPDTTTPIANYYLQPIEGLTIWVNENASPQDAVIKVRDEGTEPLTEGLININSPPNAYYDAYRGTLKPLNVCQPDGPSYTLTGNEVIWENWKFRYSVHPTFGLILNQVSFNTKKHTSDPDTYKSMLYQANLAEALTLYGTPYKPAADHNFLDIGEYQTRFFMTPLQRGVDVPPYAQLFSPVFVDESGMLFQVPNGLAIYEQDGGLLWRHYDANNGIFQGRRSRQLVITHTNCIGNYDYALYWTFNQDGTLDVSVKITGLVGYSAIDQVKVPPNVPYGQLVHPYISAANQQRIFNYRLDFDIDGVENRVYEVNTVAIEPGGDNPCSNAWDEEETLLKNSQEAQRSINPFTNRHWVFTNKNSKNSLGQSRGYTIEPKTSAKSLTGNCARISKRAHFLKHNFIATKYAEDSLYPMGKYPVEQDTDKGLKLYTDEKQNLVDEDIVGWYTMILTHKPQPENFPVLNAEEIRFTISPKDFFDQNPAINVDPDMFDCCRVP